MTPEADRETTAGKAPVPVVDAIRAAIVDGEFTSNQRLVESDLSERFQASRGNVRTALVQLSAEGLVERIANRGARVRALTLDEAVELAEVRRSLEGLCAAKAATRLTVSERERLQSIGSQMEAAVAGGNLLRYSELNTALHAMIREASGQTTARTILERLRWQSVRQQFRLAMHPGRPTVSLPEHLAIIDALCAGDADRAEAAVRAHLGSVIDTLPAVAATRGQRVINL